MTEPTITIPVALLHRALYVARHAMDLHVYTAAQERTHPPGLTGLPMPGGGLCAQVLVAADQLTFDLQSTLSARPGSDGVTRPEPQPEGDRFPVPTPTYHRRYASG